MRKTTLTEFIARAKAVHGDKYDYSHVQFVNMTTKVAIVCPVHGEFWQRPCSHLTGQGCAKCATMSIWDYDKCLLEAKKYKSRTAFAKGCASAYTQARKNGWLKDYAWFIEGCKPRKYWNYEHCYELALTCRTIKEFRAKSSTAYNNSKTNGWLDKFDWLKKKFAWTYDECKIVAKQYSTKYEFEKGNSGAYTAARRKGWINDYTWMQTNRTNVLTGKIDNVYYYYFEEYNAIYVGRTINPKKRDRDHIFNDKDTVAKFAKQHDCSIPPMVIIESNLTLAEGQEREDYWLKYYNSKGYVILNRAKTGIGTGSLGLIQGLLWNEKSCYECAKGFSCINEFRKNEVGAYTRALNRGWLKQYTWFKRPMPPNYKWSKEACREIALGYFTYTEFADDYPGAYSAAKKNDWLKEYTWFVTQDRLSDIWTKELCYERARKYTSEKEFYDNDKTACLIARHMGWNAEYSWLTNRRMYDGYWTYERCYEEAKKYKTRSEFEYGIGTAYQIARKNDWIKDYTWFEEKQKPNGYWTRERCFVEAKKYKSRSEFEYGKGASRAYKSAVKNNWIKDYTWFEEKQKPNGYWTRERCFEEAKKYKTQAELKRANPSVCVIARRNDWIRDYTWFVSKKHTWTYPMCKKLIEGCKTRTDFKRKSQGAYYAAIKNGWLAEFFPKK